MATLYIIKRNGEETARTYVKSEAISLAGDYLSGNPTLKFPVGSGKAESVTIETQKG